MRYFAGNSLAAFFRSTASVFEVTSAGRFNSTFVSSAIAGTNDTAFIRSSPFVATGTLWARFDIYTPSGGSGAISHGVSLYNGAIGVFRITATSASLGSNGMQCQYWNGTAWTNTGGAFSFAMGVLLEVVVKIVHNSSFELYIGGTLVTSGSGWTGGQTQSTAIVLYGYNNAINNMTSYSQVMAADYDLRDSHFKTTALDGNSASNTGGASGTFGDINETVLDEGTAVVVATATNKAGFSTGALTVPSGYLIEALVVNARGRIGGSITDGKLGVRGSSGTNSSGSGLAFNGGYEPRCRILETDPDTSAKFTQAGYNAAEVYLEAV